MTVSGEALLLHKCKFRRWFVGLVCVLRERNYSFMGYPGFRYAKTNGALLALADRCEGSQ